MFVFKIKVIGEKEYAERLINKINEKEKGIHCIFEEVSYEENSKINVEYSCGEEDILLVEWSDNIKFDKKNFPKEKTIFLVDKNKIDKDEKALDGKYVLSKYERVDKIISISKILVAENRNVNYISLEPSKTKVTAFVNLSNEKINREKTLGLVWAKTSEKYTNEKRKTTDKILIIDLERWPDIEISKNKNNLRRFIFLYTKEKEGITLVVEEFCEIKGKGIYQFNYNQYENPLYMWEIENIKKLIQDLKGTNNFNEITVNLGDCSYLEYKEILTYVQDLYLWKGENGENINKNKEILTKN